MKKRFITLTLVALVVSTLSINYSQAFLFNWFGGRNNNCCFETYSHEPYYESYHESYYEPYAQEYSYTEYYGPYMYY